MFRVRAFGKVPRLAAILTIAVQPMTCQVAYTQEMTARQEPIPDAVWQKMQGSSWRPNLKCPARKDLVLLTLPYLNFEGQPNLGQMIVAKSVADTVMSVFTELFESKAFRIQRMELIDKYGGDDGKSMAANNTSAFNCRLVTAGKRLSNHAFGTAIDINPIQNPWVSKGNTDPPAGREYDTPGERTADVIGIITSDGVVTKAFKGRNWGWGGDWKSLKDYQHFSENGK
ncbi:hypothetical protein BB934_45800 (plasmid) [Microvirga ossetica]|uniref:Peptidase M15C domain-containing protein n=1 Tax=Microvirga ossetica TaxID=1882682 RepID=A0A1B2EZY6_9HYPH|nr:M15 family metallopeptidase [Microvirga ossetica]ANY85536.1 hypothetical protein BB934_45800 [Microvirga ossetica]